MSNLMLDVDQAGELKAAFRRGNWTNEEIKRACEGDFLARVRAVLLGEAEITLVKRLRLLGEVLLPARTTAFNPADSLKTRDGRWVSPTFKSRILTVAKPVASLPAATCARFELARPATDAQIRAELPANHVFEDASAFCSYLDTMLERQKNGEEGDLLANGHTNLFYVRGVNNEVFTVDVCWHAHDREWGVYAWPLDGLRWGVGLQAFSSNCGPLAA